jgi:hypothetical protein
MFDVSKRNISAVLSPTAKWLRIRRQFSGIRNNEIYNTFVPSH